MKGKRKWILFNFICVMLLQVTICMGMKCRAEETAIYFSDGDLYYHVISNSAVEVCGTEKAEGTLTIPSVAAHNGKKYSVTKIADHEVYYQSKPITEKTADGYSVAISMPEWKYYLYERVDGELLPEDVFMLPGSDIEKVILPKTLTYIGEGAFCGCDNLKTVEFASRYDKLTLGENVFGGTKIASIRFPNGTYELKAGAAGTIADVYIPATVEKIGANVVNYATKKVTVDRANKSFKVKDGILYTYDEKTLVGVSADVNQAVKISDKTKKILNQAFACSKIKTVTLNDKITTISKGAFYNCKNLTKVMGGKNLRTIKYAAFANCSGLSSIDKTSKLKKIERAAFWEDSKLSISLPAGLTEIDTYAFGGTNAYANMKIKVAKGNPVLRISDGFLIKKEGNRQSIMMQMQDMKNLVIPEGVTDVAVLVGSKKCKSIQFPTSLLAQDGKVKVGDADIIYQSTTVPQFGSEYDISTSWEVVIHVPKGTSQNYQKAIGDVISQRDGYNIWENSDVMLTEE